jgi:hypothetical protein
MIEERYGEPVLLPHSQTELLPGMDPASQIIKGPLAQRFGYPPFTILDARSGAWQDRKRQWLALGIKSEMGRGDELTYSPSIVNNPEKYGSFSALGTTSIFDPTLCELAYLWWCPAGGRVLDPYAGGSVRGIVAAVCGLRYVGIELRPEQVAANRAQLRDICPAGSASWLEGDAATVPLEGEFDFILTCPPYGDIERYSDDPRDLSTMGWEEFLSTYRHIVSVTSALLRPGSFACYVVGNYRGKDGALRDLAGETVRAHQAAGMDYYNDGVLATPLGTVPVRTSYQFGTGRKLGRCHQYVMVFRKP